MKVYPDFFSVPLDFKVSEVANLIAFMKEECGAIVVHSYFNEGMLNISFTLEAEDDWDLALKAYNFQMDVNGSYGVDMEIHKFMVREKHVEESPLVEEVFSPEVKA
jgi:hypothetical protein